VKSPEAIASDLLLASGSQYGTLGVFKSYSTWRVVVELSFDVACDYAGLEAMIAICEGAFCRTLFLLFLFSDILRTCSASSKALRSSSECTLASGKFS
jgi:hypothetical protein